MFHEDIRCNVYFFQFYLKFIWFLLKCMAWSIYTVLVWLIAGFITLKEKKEEHEKSYQSFNVLDVPWSLLNPSACLCLCLCLSFPSVSQLVMITLKSWSSSRNTGKNHDTRFLVGFSAWSYLCFIFFLLLFWFKHCPYHHLCNPPWQSLCQGNYCLTCTLLISFW